MKILNTEKEDYHVHSLNFSDGMSTVDEIVRFAGELGMSKIVFADHSQASLEKEGLPKISIRSIVKDKRWRNVYNKVEVVFGVEADLLNEKGDVCFHIQGAEGDFLILSYHEKTYPGDKKKLTQAFVNAIERYHEKIDCIGHLYVYLEGAELDADKVIEAANKYNIPFELNCRYIASGKDKADTGVLKTMLSKARSIYVNSDAHTLNELRDLRKEGFKFLKENGFLK